jgi:hypothetical protein
VISLCRNNLPTLFKATETLSDAPIDIINSYTLENGAVFSDSEEDNTSIFDFLPQRPSRLEFAQYQSSRNLFVPQGIIALSGYTIGQKQETVLWKPGKIRGSLQAINL